MIGRGFRRTGIPRGAFHTPGEVTSLHDEVVGMREELVALRDTVAELKK